MRKFAILSLGCFFLASEGPASAPRLWNGLAPASPFLSHPAKKAQKKSPKKAPKKAGKKTSAKNKKRKNGNGAETPGLAALRAFFAQDAETLARALTLRSEAVRWRFAIELTAQTPLRIADRTLLFPPSTFRGASQIVSFWSARLGYLVFEWRNPHRKPPISYFRLTWKRDGKEDIPVWETVASARGADLVEFFIELIDLLNDYSPLFNEKLHAAASRALFGTPIPYPARVAGSKKSRDLNLSLRLKRMADSSFSDRQRIAFEEKAVRVMANHEIKAHFEDFLASLLLDPSRRRSFAKNLGKGVENPRALALTKTFYWELLCFFHYLRKQPTERWPELLETVKRLYALESALEDRTRDAETLVAVLRTVRGKKAAPPALVEPEDPSILPWQETDWSGGDFEAAPAVAVKTKAAPRAKKNWAGLMLLVETSLVESSL